MAIGKRLKKAREGVDREKLYPLADAIKMVKERAKSKFDETIEIAINLGVDPRHADQMVRGVVTLPNGTGRTLRVGVFARGAKAEEAKAAGADVVGAEDLVEKVQGGTIDFDRCIATPDMMPLVGRLGKVLGPRGMMPNPKIGTVTMDVTTAVKGAKGGSVEFRVEKAGIVQAGIGKASFSEEKLVQNVKALADAVAKAKPAGSKGTYIQRCIATSDMMPPVGRLGKVLGPRGMMPNSKIGTVTMDVTTAVKGAKGGSVEFRVEKAGIVQAGIGKASFSEEKLVQNVKALADAVAKAKPTGSKGTYIQRVAVSSTMGPASRSSRVRCSVEVLRHDYKKAN